MPFSAQKNLGSRRMVPFLKQNPKNLLPLFGQPNSIGNQLLRYLG
jgi:hypothetical protein